ncbi:MAG: hypothetical protein KF867_00875 [Cryobacterium sp.]|nr:hypothetical protein [Cryobacterium sp.]MBX3103508.1 hypothetical protein [Cryobacterium sp.]
MIDWGAFVVVAVAALVGASAVVAIASLGIRLFESGSIAERRDSATGKLQRLVARALFVVCAALVLFGVYLIVPFFHSG